MTSYRPPGWPPAGTPAGQRGVPGQRRHMAAGRAARGIPRDQGRTAGLAVAARGRGRPSRLPDGRGEARHDRARSASSSRHCTETATSPTRERRPGQRRNPNLMPARQAADHRAAAPHHERDHLRDAAQTTKAAVLQGRSKALERVRLYLGERARCRARVSIPHNLGFTGRSRYSRWGVTGLHS